MHLCSDFHVNGALQILYDDDDDDDDLSKAMTSCL